MNGKSIILSILSILLFGGAIFGIVFLFKFSLVAGIPGILLLIIPEILRRKALNEANGIADKIFAKFIVPVLFLVIAFLAIMSIGFWIQL